jgi:hypothetical protein
MIRPRQATGAGGITSNASRIIARVTPPLAPLCALLYAHWQVIGGALLVVLL